MPAIAARNANVSVVAAKERVLAVVTRSPVSSIGGRDAVGSAAKPRRLAFDHDDAAAGVSEPNGGTQPGKPATNHDDIGAFVVAGHERPPPGAQARRTRHHAPQLERAWIGFEARESRRVKDIVVGRLDPGRSTSAIQIDAHDLRGTGTRVRRPSAKAHGPPARRTPAPVRRDARAPIACLATERRVRPTRSHDRHPRLCTRTAPGPRAGDTSAPAGRPRQRRGECW